MDFELEIYVESKVLNLNNKNINNEDLLFNKIKYMENLEYIEELILSNNYLTRIPPDLSWFSNLKHLDLEFNPIEDFGLLAINLKKIQKLESLRVTLHKPEDQNTLLSCLPNLRILNGFQCKPIINSKINFDFQEGEISDSPLYLDLQKYNFLFTKINEKVKNQGRDAVNLFYNEYQKITNECTEKVEESNKSGLRINYHSTLLSAKYKTLNYFIEKLLELNDKKDKDLTNLFKEVISAMSEIQYTQNEIINKIVPKMEQVQNIMNKKIEDAKRINNTSVEYDKLLKRCKALKLEIETYKDEYVLIKDKFSSIDKENQILIDKVVKLTKDLADSQLPKNNLLSLGSPDKFKAYYNITKIVSPKNNIKVLTKKNMHDLIESIYSSKTTYDKKCLEIKMPRETMEQYMYTFLNQKFGLKNLIIEWATSIINGIKMYSSEDSDICLFGKILRNEVEEDYRTVFKKLKASISDLLVYFLKSKNQIKSNLEIKELANKKINKSIPVTEEEWKGILYYLYETEDAKHLEQKLVEIIRRKNFEKQNFDFNSYYQAKKQSRAELNNPLKEDLEINYKDFIRVILDYQIKCRVTYLRNLVNLFKELDTDENGIVNENEFIQLVANTDLFNENFSENSNRLLTLADPDNHKQVTFSEVVTCFAKENLKEIDLQGHAKKVNLLDKISTKEYIFNKNFNEIEN